MMKLLTLLTLVLILQTSCKSNENSSTDDQNHIFYLHGRIIEEQGINASSDLFGKYEYDSIITALRIDGSEMHAKIRTQNIDTRSYAVLLSKQIDSLLTLGVKPHKITVIGASKGAIIASHLSDLNPNPINYIFLAGNNDFQEENNDWKFHGHVLCIYDSSDNIAGKNYDYLRDDENATMSFEQLELKTKMGHGFLYKPLESWIIPCRKWILNREIE